MVHIFGEFVKVAILRARPVEFLRFWREIQLYPGNYLHENPKNHVTFFWIFKKLMFFALTVHEN